MGWLAQVLAYHPFAVLIAVTVFSATCVIVPLSVLKLPNFKDPQLGFEARGTEIGERLISFENLIGSIGTFGLLTAKPVIPPVNKKDKSSKKTEAADANSSKDLNTVNSLIPKSPISNIPFVVNASQRLGDEDEVDDWQELKEEIKESSHHDHVHLSDDQFYCTKLSYDYARLVFTSTDGSDLFNMQAISDMCELEHTLTSMAGYNMICEQITEAWCCRQWSLPNYIAMLNNKTSCRNITELDVNRTKKLFVICHHYFLDLNHVPDFTNKEMPPECMKHDAVHNMIHYILDYEYVNQSLPLKNVMVFLPIARGSSSLDFYYLMSEHELERGKIKVAAIDFGLKYTLFDEYLIKDTQLMFYGAICVLLTMWMYTGSFFITFMTVLAIGYSLGVSYFIYRLVFGFKFFPFMNMLASVVAIGIGGDSCMIVHKLWMCARENETNIKKVVRSVHGHSVMCMIASSLTTCIAFYSSFISKITTIRCFSVFAGTSVVANFFILILWAPASLVISEKLPSVRIIPASIKSAVASTSQTVRNTLFTLVLRFRYVWLLLFSSMALISIPVIFYYPRFRLSDSTDLQLFASSHLFEQYDMVYKDRFHFERILKMESWMENQRRMPLRFVWGVVPEDNGDYMDPFRRGKLVLDNSFDLASKDSQTWLLSFCINLKMQPFYQPTFGPLVANCFIEPFVAWMEQKCMDPIDHLTREPCCESAVFPYERNVFSLCLAKAAISLYNTPSNIIMPTIAGPKFLSKSKAKVPKVKAFIVEYDANLTLTTSYTTMDNFYNEVEMWTRKEFDKAPAGMRNGWFISDLGLYDLQKTLVKDTITSLFIAMAASFLVVAFTTFNVTLSLLAMITITFTILVTVAVLVLMGWKLNILEAVSVCLAIGLAVDFSMHYTINYKYAPENSDRKSAVFYTLSIMTGPVSVAAMTTLVSGAFMLPSHVLAYTQIGTFLVVVMVVSWSFATFFLPSLLCALGPVNLGSSTVSSREQHELEALSRSRRRAEHSPSAASATTIIHEEDCEIILKPTPSTT
uniref:Protein dispatched 1 n=2 Tax=Lygus hesperus TaxID=30085 RepID=A0A0A9XAS5_LYGHE